MSTAPLRVAAVSASVREGRFGPTVTDWLAKQIEKRDDLNLDVIDLADHPLPNVLSNEPPADVAGILTPLRSRMESADAFVINTPEYNHSFPASLKSLIDWHYTQWRAKPVAFVSYGGLAGGLRAVEQLRPVLSELHAVTLRDTVSFHMAWDLFGTDGVLESPEAANAAATTMLDQLAWWGNALREARGKQPYPA
jgi:NAD(P)H-dependent FMN reductase